MSNPNLSPHDFTDGMVALRNTKIRIQELIDHDQPIKALCWKQPFASLMLPPFNKVETRTRPINYRGLVLIVATEQQYSSQQVVAMSGLSLAQSLYKSLGNNGRFFNGHAIAIGNLHLCRPIIEGDNTYLKPELHEGRYAWVFQDVCAIEPIPMKGFQGWRNVEAELRAKIKLA